MTNRELLPGLFLEVTASDHRITTTHITSVPDKKVLPASLEGAVDRFLDRWRRGVHEPMDDALFLFSDTLLRWAPLLLRLKNDIAPGMTITYGELGSPLGIHPRTVGMVMARNPFPLLIPCHRVLGLGGRLTGFSAEGGVETKRRLLKLENGSR